MCDLLRHTSQHSVCLFIDQRIEFKLAVLVYMVCNNLAPQHLIDDCQLIAAIPAIVAINSDRLITSNVPLSAWTHVSAIVPSQLLDHDSGAVSSTHSPTCLNIGQCLPTTKDIFYSWHSKHRRLVTLFLRRWVCIILLTYLFTEILSWPVLFSTVSVVTGQLLLLHLRLHIANKTLLSTVLSC